MLINWLILTIHCDVNSKVLGTSGKEDSELCLGKAKVEFSHWVYKDIRKGIVMESEKIMQCLKMGTFYIAEIYVVWGLFWKWQCPRRIISFPKWLSSLTPLFREEKTEAEKVSEKHYYAISSAVGLLLLMFHKNHDLTCSLLIKIRILSYFLELVLTITFQ